MTQVWKYTNVWIWDADVTWENVYHYAISPNPSSAALLNLSLQFETLFNTYLQGMISDDVQNAGWYVRQVDIADQPTYWFPWSATGTGYGTDGISMMPAQVAMVVNVSGITTYPRLGRTYISGFCEDSNGDPGVPSAGAKAAAASYIEDALLFSLTGGYTATRVAVRYTGSPPYVNVYNNLINWSVSPRWGTMRSRKS